MPYLNNQICNGGMIPQCSHKLKGLHCLFAHIQNTACRMTVLLVLKHQWWYRDGHVFCLHLPETQMLPCEDHNEKNFVFFFCFTGKSAQLSFLHVEAIRSIMQSLQTWSGSLSQGEACGPVGGGGGLLKCPDSYCKKNLSHLALLLRIAFHFLGSFKTDMYFTDVKMLPQGTMQS